MFEVDVVYDLHYSQAFKEQKTNNFDEFLKPNKNLISEGKKQTTNLLTLMKNQYQAKSSIDNEQPLDILEELKKDNVDAFKFEYFALDRQALKENIDLFDTILMSSLFEEQTIKFLSAANLPLISHAEKL